MELRDVLTIIGVIFTAICSYYIAMNKMTLKIQHLEDAKVDRSEIYETVQNNQKEIMKEIGEVKTDVMEIKTKVNGLQCNKPDWNPGKC